MNPLDEFWHVSDNMDNGGSNIVTGSNVIIVGTSCTAPSETIARIVNDHNELLVLKGATRVMQHDLEKS